jgi:hypothetical protein
VNLSVNNPPKALIVLVGLICLTVLMALDGIDKATGAGMFGTIIGYAVGNGIAARNGQPVEPMIGNKPEPQPERAPLGLPGPSGWRPDPGPE